MALEQYSKRQKFWIVFLSILGAALFTVTGSMLAFTESCGQTQSMSAGSIDGKIVSHNLFQMRRLVIDMTFRGQLRGPAVPVFPDEKMKKLLISKNMPDGAPAYPLLALWPEHHDQRVWLFALAVEKAESKGFNRPTRAAARAWYESEYRRTNDEVPDDFDVQRHYESQSISNPEDFERALGELMVLNAYTSSLTQAAITSRSEELDEFRNRWIEAKADIYSLTTTSFESEAQSVVRRQDTVSKVASVAASLIGAGDLHPYASPLESVRTDPTHYQKKALTQEQKVAFDVVAATLQPVNIDARPLPAQVRVSAAQRQEFYDNQLHNFRVSPAHATKEMVEQRLADIQKDNQVQNREQLKKDLALFYDYREKTPVNVGNRIDEMMALWVGTQVGPVMINEFKRELDEEREDREKEAKQKIDARRAWASVPQAKLDWLNSFERSLKNLTDVPFKALARAAKQGIDADGKVSNTIMDARRIYDGIQAAIADPSKNQSALSLALKLRTDQSSLNIIEQSIDDKTAAIAKLDSKIAEATASDEKQRLRYEQETLRYQLEGEEAKLALASSFDDRLEEIAKAFEEYAYKVEMSIVAMRDAGDPDGAILLRNALSNLIISYPDDVEAMIGDLISEDLESEIREEVDRRKSIVDREDAELKEKARDFSDVDGGFSLRQRASIARQYPFLGVSMDGFTLEYYHAVREPKILEELSRDPEWHWVSVVDAAKNFLSGKNLEVGQLSSVIERPGFGWYIFRIRAVEAAVEKAPEEEKGRIQEFAVASQARKLAQAELEKIRRVANSKGSKSAATAYLDEMVKSGVLSKRSTSWFVWNRHVPELKLASDPDRKSATGLSERNPQDAFFDALFATASDSPVGASFLEGDFHAADPLTSTYWYSVPVLSGMRVPQDRSDVLPGSENELDSMRNALSLSRLGVEQDIIDLLNPVALLEGHKVEYDTSRYRRGEESKKDEEEGNE